MTAKTCTCCHREHDSAAWAALPLVGYVGSHWAGGKAIAVELRNCVCGSTIGVEVEVTR